MSLQGAYDKLSERRLDRVPGLNPVQVRFARDRFVEGKRIRDSLRNRHPSALTPVSRVLDLGCGDGGFSLPFSEDRPGGLTVGVELEPRPEIPATLRRCQAAYAHAAACGEQLPFRDRAFDLVLLVETLEHLEDPGRVASEVSRVLAPAGLCFVTTPARFRFLLRRDPHRQVPGLLLLPDRLQPWICKLVTGADDYDVVHTFWTSWGIARLFPGMQVEEVVSRNWSGFLRRLDWDWLILRKTVRAGAR